MLRILLLLCLLLGSFSYAQFNESAPWMKELEKGKTSTNKVDQNRHSIYEISEAFHSYWDNKAPDKKGSGFKPYMRWEEYWKHFVDKDGYLPSSNDLWNTWTQKVSGLLVPNPVSDWTSIGPFSHGTLSGALPGQGRVNAIAVDPNDENTWYVGAPAGGIWRTTNSGNSWVNLFDDFPQIGVSGIAIDPSNSNIIYIASGDDDAADSYSVGVFKSTNRGNTWQQTGLNPSNTDINSLMNEIVVDPTNSDIVWVATNFGLQKSEDGGITWDVKLEGNIRDFKLKPGAPNTIYAVSTSNYYKTTNGENFTEITDILPDVSGRLVLGVSPADPNILYILSADTGSQGFSYQGFYRSEDSGETFEVSPNTTDIMESSQAWFDLALEVSPTNADELYMGCLNIWKSENGGDSFSQVNQWFDANPAYTHADIHTLKFFNGNLYCGSDGGLFRSEDNGVSFTNLTEGIAIGQIYRISVAPNNAQKMITGLQDNGGQVFNNQRWDNYFASGGDGMDNVIDPNNENLIYGFIQFGQLLNISTQSGQSVGVIGGPRDAQGNPIQGNWITPLAISSEGDVYAGYRSVYRLNGTTWEQISGVVGSGNIEDIEVDPNNPMVIYVAEDNIVFRSENGGITFSTFNVFDSEISDIAINANDSNILYVTTSKRVGISQNQQQPERGVFKLTRNSTTVNEEDITFDLPTDQAFFSIVHQGRHTDNPIYVGTSLGVYRLDDTLTEWEEYFANLPSVAVSDLDISLDDELITASTYGRGVWQSPIPIQVPENDIRLVSITPDAGTVECGNVVPQIVVQNRGLNTISNIDITYSVNDGTDQNTSASVSLSTDQITTIDLPSLNINEIGSYLLEVRISIENDTFSDNNNGSTSFFINEIGVGGDVNTFENAVDELVSYIDGDTGALWERGVPNGNILNEAGSGTMAYATNLNGNHPDGTKALLLSNCYDFTSILGPVLKFNMAYDLEINFDIVYLEYSTDGGSSWAVLGTTDSQPNWYISDRTENSGAANDCQNCPGGQWTGTNATITEYAYDFTANAVLGEADLTNESNIIFRIVFHSDFAVTQEGAVVDDLVVEGFEDDEDDDNDGVLDPVDNCPLVANANQLDSDGDGDGDSCDTDDDNDGVPDIEDNCPLNANANQGDDDNDGIGNVCDDDQDNDGVPNANDQCENTPQDAIVDVTGCEIFSLPPSNFRVLVTGESCISSDNGSIQISTEEVLNYSATLTGDGVDETLDFTETAAFEDLIAGNYTICITVDNQAGYENCFDVTVTQPQPLSVFSKVSTLKNELTLSLSGGKEYTITLNGIDHITKEGEITLPLSKVENILSVKTDLPCQGIYTETIVLSNKMFIYPNPVSGQNLNIYLGDMGVNQVVLSLHSVNGTQIFGKRFNVINKEVQLNIESLAKGIYLLNIKTDTSLYSYKIIRR